MLRSTWLRSDRKIGALWCSLVHDSLTWPIHGHYECRICGRQYPVAWAEAESTGSNRMRRAALPSVPSALVPVLVLMAAAVWPSRGAESMIPDSSPAATAVLQRFIAAQGAAGAWPMETVEIEASLPGLKKTGRMLAIRRALDKGQPDYKVLEVTGDRTVKNQVIVRYISAEEKTTELPASSIAVTPANYKIRYAGTVQFDERQVYAFRVIPRKRREGLINGVLWLDGETGMVVREYGYLAKNPSVFLKRVNLTRENQLRNGTIEARITHVSIETRLVGRAELVVVERPVSSEAAARGPGAEGQ